MAIAPLEKQAFLVVDVGVLRDPQRMGTIVAQARKESWKLFLPHAAAYELCRGGVNVKTLEASSKQIVANCAIDLFVLGRSPLFLRACELETGCSMTHDSVDVDGTNVFHEVIRDIAGGSNGAWERVQNQLETSLASLRNLYALDDAARVTREATIAFASDSEEVRRLKNELPRGNRARLHEWVAGFAGQEDVEALINSRSRAEVVRESQKESPKTGASLSSQPCIVWAEYAATLLRGATWAVNSGIQNTTNEKLEHDARDAEYAIFGILGRGLETKDRRAFVFFQDLTAILQRLGWLPEA
jgi:hypothetical protein